MEKSIKRVEKLLHATSSTLAQMKFSLMFDDMNGKKDGQAWRSEGFDANLLAKFLQTDDLNFRQNEFQLEANEAFAKIDKILPPNKFTRKNTKPIDRIKEINNKMNHLKLDQLKRGETKQSRQKLLSLISEEKFSPGMTSCKDSTGSKTTARYEEKETRPVSRKTESVLSKSPIKSKGELKNRILETQEIVDRGFQTARLLSQKVESMTKLDKKDRTPSTGKTISDINLRSLDGKTESNETIKTVKCCRRSERRKKKEADFQDVEKINSRVIDIKRNDLEKETKSNLQLQQLPSLHIRGGLKVQKVHSLEIPASENVVVEKTNTAISFLSHDQMEKEKMEKILEKVRKENCGCVEDDSRTNYVECFNCGKLIKIRETLVNPQRIDEVLRKCDFNVFDPRIDEFVEKCGGVEATNRCEETPTQSDVVVLSKNPERIPEVKEVLKDRRRFKLRDLSDRMCKKYKEEADALVDSHFKLDAILRNLFRKVEESKEVFESCHLLKPDWERAPVLSTTKPVLVSLPGVKIKPQKLDKKDVKNRSKSRTVDEKDVNLPTTREGFSSFVYSEKNKNTQKRLFNESVPHPEINTEKQLYISSPSSSSSGKPDLKQKKYMKTLIMASIQRKDEKLPENKSLSDKSRKTQSSDTEEEKDRSSVTSSVSSIKGSIPDQENLKNPREFFPTYPFEDVEKKLPIVSPKKSNFNKDEESCQTPSRKSENNYESDFESFTNEFEEKVGEYENIEPEIILSGKKLSTISEVDSEQEKKVSDNQKSVPLEGDKEGDSIGTGISVKSKKSPKTSLKSTRSELVTSLKDILSALQDQFAKTESLAEKLTDTSKVEKMEKPWKNSTPAEMVESLKSSRKDWSPKQKFSLSLAKNPTEGISSADGGVSEEGGSSLGEIIVSEGRKINSATSTASSISEESHLNLPSAEKS